MSLWALLSRPPRAWSGPQLMPSLGSARLDSVTARLHYLLARKQETLQTKFRQACYENRHELTRAIAEVFSLWLRSGSRSQPAYL